MNSLEKLNNFNILLASESIRRQEILSEIGLKFTIVKLSDNEESYPDDVVRENIPIYIAKQKSEKYKNLKFNDLLITADTIVWLEGEVLGKPKNYDEAFKMLKLLSGKEHFVFTGVCLKSISKEITFYSESKVKFCEISDIDIKYYIENYNPYDKAGAYGIQEWIGKFAVEKIDGSFYNVVGLPINKLITELKNF